MFSWMEIFALAAIVYLLVQILDRLNQLQKAIDNIPRPDANPSKLDTDVGEMFQPAVDRVLWKLGYSEADYQTAVKADAEEKRVRAEKAAAIAFANPKDAEPVVAATFAYMAIAGTQSLEDAHKYSELLETEKKAKYLSP